MKRVTRYRASVGAAVLAVGALAAFFAVFSADSHIAGSVIARPLGWSIPLGVAAVLLGVSWVLLGQGAEPADGDAETADCPCPSCGTELLGQWRMCPYCGTMLDAERERPE